MSYPQMVRIKQRLDDTRLEDLSDAIKSEMKRELISPGIKPGDKVAITAGSRGITDIVTILASIVREVKKKGGDPFIVPSMGSHGEATATGQLEILEDYGITRKSVGAPILSSMEVLKLGETQSEIPVFMDKIACEADHIIVLNRIKPHTEFQGEIESGLIKMIAIGLGNHRGAITAHRFAVRYGYVQTMAEICECAIEKAPISLGIGIVENGLGQTAQIFAVKPESFFEAEKRLLEMTRSKTAKIPFDNMDILIVDECGKEISGTGMDTKVIGRIMNIYEAEVSHPKIIRIILRDLSEKTHGNAVGVGLADFVTKRVAEKIDYKSTYLNAVTAVTPEKGRLPIVCANDREALDFAMATAGPIDSKNGRIVWIRNTSCLDEMFISRGFLSEARKNEGLVIDENVLEIEFDKHGNLVNIW